MSDIHGNLPLRSFRDREAFEEWLAEHHTTVPALWVRFYRKDSGVPTVVYDEAVDAALCFGWIDSQAKSLDEESYIQRFGPRKAKSPWSEINKERVARLMREGRMREAGFRAIEAAKANGEWERAYASPSTMTPPPEFVQALHANEKAEAFFATLSKTQQFYFLYRIVTAKRPETKEKRIREAIAKLERGEKMNS
jgi:uncharacterized protein YdeI (YjbR/CyaY-like superfamily)